MLLPTTALIWAAVFPLPGGTAEAHAILVRSDPPVNARLQVPPQTVTGFFSEPLDTRLSSMEVVDGTGQRVDAGETVFGPDPAQMSVEIQGEIPPGFYMVIWETLSTIDGHLLKGSYPFTVLNPDGSEPSGPRFAGPAGFSGGEPGFDNVPVKFLGLLGAFGLAGGLAFFLWVARPASGELRMPWKDQALKVTRRNLRLLAVPSIVALIVAGAGEIVVQTRQLGSIEFLDEVLSTFWGERWLQRQAVLATTIIALFLSEHLWSRDRERLSEAALWVALAGALGYMVLVAMVSHAGSVPGSFWAVATDFTHLVAAAVWIGMLVQMALFLAWTRNVPPEERPLTQVTHLQRFSAVAAVSVLLLLASGIANALVHVPAPQSMLETAYGRTLSLKLGILLLLLAVAGVNAFHLRPRLVDDETGADSLRRRLSIMVRVEIGLAVAVVLAAALLIQYPTSKQERAAEINVQQSTQAVVGYEETQPAGDLLVNLSISPNTVGTNSFRVFLFPQSGGTVGEVLRVRLRFSPPSAELGPSEIIAEQVDRTAYAAVGAFFTEPGNWQLSVDVRRRQVDDVTASFPVPVEEPGLDTGTGFSYPLVAGSWMTVGATGLLLLGLIAGIWASQWPGLPAPTPRLLRTSSAAITVIGVGLLGLSLLPGEESASGNPVEPTAQSIAIGRSLYAQNCAQCHGIKGDGRGPLADEMEVPPADFRIHVPFHSDEFFFNVISNGLGDIMPAWSTQFSEEEIWHLINFLKSEYGIEAREKERRPQ
jgi:copper transport protein